MLGKTSWMTVFTRNLVSTICSKQHHLLALKHFLRQSPVPVFVECKIPEKKEGKFKSRIKFLSWVSANQSFRDPLEFTFLRTRILIKPIEEGFLIKFVWCFSESRTLGRVRTKFDIAQFENGLTNEFTMHLKYSAVSDWLLISQLIFPLIIFRRYSLKTFRNHSWYEYWEELVKMLAKMILQTFCFSCEKEGKIYTFIKSVINKL